MIVSSQITVTSTPVSLLYVETTDAIKGQTVAIRNLSSAAVLYIGANDVTTSTGFPIEPGEQFAITMTETQQVYAVTATTCAAALLWIDAN